MIDYSAGKTLLVIDDDRLFCDTVRDYFQGSMKEVLIANTGCEGLEACLINKVDVVLLDQNLPDMEGQELCPDILKYNDQTKIIFVTAHPSFEGAVKAIKTGAHDYLSKPFELEELSLTVENAVKTLALEKVAQVEEYKSNKESEGAVLVGHSAGILEVLKFVDLAASEKAPVLVTGETGTGKNVVASLIHYRGTSKKNAFISINCAALPENLIEAELFGYVKGAFTGAVTSRKGIFEMAEGGTLFLDEIGEMPMHLQTKLLGVLEDKQVRRIGGEAIRPVDVRIIAATGSELEKVLGKTFRSDLYYRLSVVRMHIPPLRERKQDIPELCDYMLKKIALGRDCRLSDHEVKKLMQYDWPGNVRELKNILERSFILQRGNELRPSELLMKTHYAQSNGQEITFNKVIKPLEEIEKQHIKYALEELSGNLTKTAKALGISLSTLKRKVRDFNLT